MPFLLASLITITNVTSVNTGGVVVSPGGSATSSAITGGAGARITTGPSSASSVVTNEIHSSGQNGTVSGTSHTEIITNINGQESKEVFDDPITPNTVIEHHIATSTASSSLHEVLTADVFNFRGESASSTSSFVTFSDILNRWINSILSLLRIF